MATGIQEYGPCASLKSDWMLLYSHTRFYLSVTYFTLEEISFILMLIRCYEHPDREAVIALWGECNLSKPWNGPGKDIARKLEVNPELFFVGEVDNQIIATAMAGYEGHRGWVNYLAVSPRCQSKGYGRQLMHHIEHALLLLGCPKINLQIRHTNEEALAFYRSIGYQVDESVSMGKRLIPDN